MDAIIEKITPFENPQEWKGQCVVKIREALNVNQSTDIFANFVDRAGKIISNPLATPNLVAGIDYKACVEYCGYNHLSTVFSFEIFSGATNYLLPWLALTAQLPFETGENEVLANMISFSYAVGSPMLITYSLATTILNQHWLREKFRKLEAPDRPLHLTSKNVRIFLQESQQLPLRLSQEDGSLASLIVLSDNVDWWEKLKTSILLTRRGVTLSLVAQILVAVLSWILTVISAFESSLGNASEALALSSGTLWVWLVPIIYGWIVVGTQRQHGTIVRALKRDMINISDGHPPSHSSPDRSRNGRTSRDTLTDTLVDAPTRSVPAVHGNEPQQVRSGTGSNRPVVSRASSSQRSSVAQIVEERQKAFKVAHERKLMQPVTRSPIEDGFFRLEPPSSDFDIPNCLGLSVAGDEKQEGPAFNYARIFTWWNMANRLYQALEETDENLDKGLDLDLKHVPRDQKFGQDNLKGDVLALSRYCGLTRIDERLGEPGIEPEEISEYPRWSQLDSEFYQRMIIAMAIAVYVQWGIISAGLIIAYLTEVTGLGCRSGAYLLYGVLGTLAFFFLFISSIFSHAAMLRHEFLQTGSIDGLHEGLERDPCGEQNIASPKIGRSSFRKSNIHGKKLGLRHSILRSCAVLTRILGRTLAVVNAIWIILSTLWELVGFYDNCWCDTTYISKGAEGWVLLFVEKRDMAQAAAAPWAGGVFLSVFVGATSCGVFWLYCRGNRA
ncbi:hypothetical protein O1611_g1750 [Lasiodiplodia mahajangana]|uniref:Uncharacterized protein n=1 Tax=Lasiodiplodia mahajangana TaxID=1108764 RepID=A0ACC2JWG6_9PEZI|nr:hypothetical protein O1611_g1750 [Lasiodiplodia mahajangana]